MELFREEGRKEGEGFMDSKTPEELFASLEDFSASHQFEGKKAVVI